MYREQPPTRPLSPFVECIWTTEMRMAPGEQRAIRVLPDGCMDVLFNVGDRPRPEGCPHWRLSAYVVGPMPTAEVIRVVGRVSLVGVRFRPGGAPAFLGVPAATLRGGVLALDELWRADAAEAADRLAGADGPAARARVLASVLEARLEGATAPDPLVLRAQDAIRASGGRAAVAELARHAGTSVRSLERRYAAAVGLAPKEAARVARFRRAVALLEQDDRPLAGVAAACGYADQAHLTREARALAGATPAVLRVERAAPAVASVQDGAGAAA